MICKETASLTGLIFFLKSSVGPNLTSVCVWGGAGGDCVCAGACVRCVYVFVRVRVCCVCGAGGMGVCVRVCVHTLALPIYRYIL